MILAPSHIFYQTPTILQLPELIIHMAVKFSTRNILKHEVLQISSFLLILTATISHATSPNIITSMPGFPGKLPFHFETGYVGVGENEGVQLFYYFTKSERDPQVDPLMVWLTGGPGCSALSGLVLEIGPMIFNTSACNWHSKAPTFQSNPFSWTKVASIIFLDSPVGTGFSYAKTPEDSYSDDIRSSRQIYQFLRKWLLDHAEFHNNPLYISGDSYSGKVVPIVVQHILDGNKAGFQPVMNLQGYILGNPFTREEDGKKLEYEYAQRVSLLSDELYESTRISCNGTNYKNVDKNNVKCKSNLQAVKNALNSLFRQHILLPMCIQDGKWCPDSMYYLLENWADDIQVRATLNIQEGTTNSWIRCNHKLPYDTNVESTFGYHQNFTQEFIRALIYSGDQDLSVSYVRTLGWIKILNVSIAEHWRPWFSNGQVAGYTTKYSNHNYHLTFATMKGAGHTGPEYKRLEGFTMLSKWLAKHPL